MSLLLILAILEVTPAGTASRFPSLSSSGETVCMTWWEGHSLRFAKHLDDEWTQPVTIVSDRRFFINWADFPSVLALSDSTFAVNWLERSGSKEERYAYDIRIARSTDGGETWSEGIRPHHDDTKTEHGFVSLLDRGTSGLSAVWLDGRQYANHKKEMTLRFGTLDGSRFGRETLLDARVCDCCQTGAAITKRGPLVAYRDRAHDEIRDIAYVRLVDGTWTAPKTLHEDGWKIAGCPVNGPRVAATGEDVVIVWTTFAGGVGKVQAIFSRNSGETFGEPVRIDSGTPIGRVDVVWWNGRAVISWMEFTKTDQAVIRVRAIDTDAKTPQPAQTIDTARDSRKAGFPRMTAAAGDGVWIAWTGAEGVQAKRLDLDVAEQEQRGRRSGVRLKTPR